MDKIKFSLDEQEKLNEKLKKNNWIENQFNEAKFFNNIDKIRSDEVLYESHLIKPLVGFLNSLEGFGTLYLGIDTGGNGCPKFLGVKPIKKEIIKNEEALRSLIFDKLGILPYSIEKPKIEIEKIEFKEGNVFIVFIERKNNNSGYYSRITNQIYKRNADETNRFDLVDSLHFLESKKNPQLRLNFQPKMPTTEYRGLLKQIAITNYVYNVVISNEGLEPGFFVTGIVEVKINRHPEIDVSKKINILTPNNWKFISQKEDLEIYQFNVGMNLNNAPIYPKIGMNFGEFKVNTEGNTLDIEIRSTIADTKGISEQEFNLGIKWEEENKTISFGPHDEKFKYEPYFQ